MPTFKHPCPYCGKFIDRISVACPYCGVKEPFSPKRCQACRKIVEDPAWTICPSCGNSLVAPPPGASAQPGAGPSVTSAAGTPPGSPTPPAPAIAPAPSAAQPAVPAAEPAPPAPAARCSGCGAPLPGGARFCTVCGTIAG